MPDQYGNPTEEELRGTYTPVDSGYTPYTPEMLAAIAAQHAAAPQRDNSPGARNFQSANPNDPYLQRSDIANATQATNRDVRGNGRYGIRGWMNEHPVGTMAAFIAAAAGGAAAMPQAAGAAGGAAGGGAAAGSGSGLGVFANGGAGGLAGVGGGNAGALAASGGITGGAGTGFLGSLGGGSGLLSSNSIKNAGRLNGLMGGDSGGAQMPYTGLGSNYSQPTAPAPQQQQQTGFMGSQTRLLPSMNQPLQSFGRKPLHFNGATVWV